MVKKEETTEVRFVGSQVLGDSNDITRELYDKTRFGEPIRGKKFQYALLEALHLLERKRFVVVDGRGKKLSFNDYVKKASRVEKNFWTRYLVFSDLRRRGYIVKTALKFGADFRVYDRGVKPGDDHAKWVVFPVSEGNSLTWFEFAAKNRVAHSTRKRLLLGIADAEGEVTYYEVAWKRP